MIKHILRTIPALAFVASFSVSDPGDAQAYQGVSAFMCHVAQHDWPHTVASEGNGLENRSGNPGSRQMIVDCPVIGDKVPVTKATVTVIDKNNELSAELGEFQVRACSNNSSGGSFACTAFQTLRVSPSEVFVGTNKFQLNTSIINELNFFSEGHRFLKVSIPRPGSAGNSRLIGYEVNPA